MVEVQEKRLRSRKGAQLFFRACALSVRQIFECFSRSHSYNLFALNRAVIEIGRSAVTPGVTILVGVALAKLIAPPIGTAANALGLLIIEATNLRPFFKINHKVQRILSDGCTFFLFQNSPDILPVLSTSIRSSGAPAL